MAENLPTEPGYYWHRDIDPGCGEAFEWEPRKVFRHIDDKKILVSEACDGTRNLPISEFKNCEWGPRIPDPEELQEQADADKELDAAIKRSIKHAHDMVRDDLAQKFLVGILSNSQLLGTEDGVTLRTDLAYRYADAMLTKRKKEQ